jgi:hypothetical protein
MERFGLPVNARRRILRTPAKLVIAQKFAVLLANAGVVVMN